MPILLCPHCLTRSPGYHRQDCPQRSTQHVLLPTVFLYGADRKWHWVAVYKPVQPQQATSRIEWGLN